MPRKINKDLVKGIQERALKRKLNVNISVRVLDSKDKLTGFKTYTIYWFFEDLDKLPKRHQIILNDRFNEPKTRTVQVYKPSGVIKKVFQIQYSLGENYKARPSIVEETSDNFMKDFLNEAKSDSKSVSYEHELNYYLRNLSVKRQATDKLMNGEDITEDEKIIRDRVINIEQRMNKVKEDLNKDYEKLSDSTKSIISKPSPIFVDFNVNRNNITINSCGCLYSGSSYKIKSLSSIHDYKHGEPPAELSVAGTILFEDQDREVVNDIVYRYPSCNTVTKVRELVNKLEKYIVEDTVTPFDALKTVTDGAYINVDKTEIYDINKEAYEASKTSNEGIFMYPVKGNKGKWYSKYTENVKYRDVKQYFKEIKCDSGRSLNDFLSKFTKGINSYQVLNDKYKNKEVSIIEMDINSFYPYIESSMRFPVNLNKVSKKDHYKSLTNRTKNYYYFGIFKIVATLKKGYDLAPVYGERSINKTCPMDRLYVGVLRKYYDIKEFKVIELWETDLNKSYLSFYNIINDIYREKEIIDYRRVEDNYVSEEEREKDEKRREEVKSMLNTHIGMFGHISDFNSEIVGVNPNGTFIKELGDLTYENMVYYFMIHFKIMKDMMERYEKVKNYGYEIVHVNVDSIVIDTDGKDPYDLPEEFRTSQRLGQYKSQYYPKAKFVNQGTRIYAGLDDEIAEVKLSGYNGSYFEGKKYSEVIEDFKLGFELRDWKVKGKNKTYKIGDTEYNREQANYVYVADMRTTQKQIEALDIQDEYEDIYGLNIDPYILDKLDI